MKTGALLLFLLSAVTELNGESVSGHSLSCYKCFSNTSWEDCDKNMHGINCLAGVHEVCLKIERTSREDNSEVLTTTYSRLCNIAEQCTQKECQEKGWNCKIECCFTNLCNVNIIMSPHALLIGVFLCLALEAINAF